MAQRGPKVDQKFSQLVEGIVKKAQRKTTCESSDTLCDVIRVHINNWLEQSEGLNPLYKVSEIIPVGSYAEGTKITQPDEFDYLVVIEEFSKPGLIEIDASEHEIQQGLVNLTVIDKELKSKCSGLCKDGHLKCFQPINFPGLTEKRFGHILIESLWKFVKCSKILQATEALPTHISTKILLPTVNQVSLYFKGADFCSPNVLIIFEYEATEVTVDVSPAIRYHKINDCFREKDCAGPAFAELVHNRNSLLFVGTRFESYFKLTVTEAEVEYIKRVMKPKHKIIYIFLKYIVELYKDIARLSFTFTSYMMKTICIHHDIKCDKDDKSMKECFNYIVGDLNACKEQTYVMSIVNKHIYIGPTDLDEERKFQRECVLKCMRNVLDLPPYIETMEALEAFLKQTAKDERNEILEAAAERDKANEEYQESLRAEQKAMVSNFVNMGFELEEVKKALDSALYDEELALRILLQWKAKKLEKEKNEVKAKPTLRPVSDTEQGISHAVSEETSNTTDSVAEEVEQSRRLLLPALPKAHEAKYEILYQRRKDM